MLAVTLNAENLSVSLDGTVHLDHVDFTLARGRLYTVIGRTLAGKSTLLRVIAGLLEPDSGRITLDKRQFSGLPVWRRDVAMVYQQFINYPHLSVLDNVAFPLRRRGTPKHEARRRAGELLMRVGLEGFETRRPSQLSGGQQQRVALARALAKQAGILLLDEPLVNLDYKLREQFREEFRGLFAGQADMIGSETTTESCESMMLGHEILVLHEGRLLQMGRPADVFERPASTTVAEIVNDPPMNLLDGHIADNTLHFSSGMGATLPLHMVALPPGRYRFGIRANDLEMRPDGAIGGEVIVAEVSGSETFLHLDTAIGPLAVKCEGIHPLALRTQVRLALEPERLFAFSPEGGLVAAP